MKTEDALALAKRAKSGGAAIAPPIVSVIETPRHIASLWSGMGSIVRIKCRDAAGDGRTLIAKRIRCIDPRSLGDKRKAASYRVEAAFYSRYSVDLSESLVCCEGLHVEDDGRGSIIILMTPLPNPILYRMDGPTAEAAVRSVARLHARFWGAPKADAAVERGGLAEQGTYWYLDTRPDEYDAMSRSGLSGRLKKAARTIDDKLKNHDYQTVVHGDLKSCNMSLSTDPRYVTFCDFQYIGKACPAKDIAYLFVCGMDVDDHFEQHLEKQLMQLYIDELKASGVGAQNNNKQNRPLPTLDKLGKALDLAYCDLYRWMLGWGVWGNAFLEDRVERCLDDAVL